MVHISSLSAADAVMDEVANKLPSVCNEMNVCNVTTIPVASQDVFVPLTLDMFPEEDNFTQYISYGAGMYICKHTRTNAIYQY